MQRFNSIDEGGTRRPLNINFEQYAHFKRELIDRMIESLQELQQAYALSSAQLDMTMFLKACHKTKTTLRILEDTQLIKLVEELKKPGIDAEGVALFHQLIAEIITSLWMENEGEGMKMVC